MLDTSLARKTLGWEPEMAVADGLAETVAWLREREAVREHGVTGEG